MTTDSPTTRQLRRLLALLGYDATGDDIVLTVRVSAWLDEFERRKKDPEGADAFLWSETFTRLLTGATAFDPDARVIEAVRGADVGCAQYARRFPPVGQGAPAEYLIAKNEESKASDHPAYAVGVEEERKRWADTTGCSTPGSVSVILAGHRELDAEWQRVTGVQRPELYNLPMAVIDATRDCERSLWIEATGCSCPQDAKHLIQVRMNRVQQWEDETGFPTPEKAKAAILDAYAQARRADEIVKIYVDSAVEKEADKWRSAMIALGQSWAKATRSESPEAAKGLFDGFETRLTAAEERGASAECKRWRSVAAVDSPEKACERLNALDKLEHALDADTAETIADARALLSGVISAPQSTTLSGLAAGVLEFVAGRKRAADTLAERSEAKMRAERDSALQAKATAEERLAQVQQLNKDLAGRVDVLTREAAVEREGRRIALDGHERMARENAVLIGEKLRAERERDEYRHAGMDALVPLPKPAKVEPGQRWAHIFTIKELSNGDGLVAIDDNHNSFWADGLDRFDDFILVGSA